MPRFDVEIVYATPDRQWLHSLTVSPGDSVADVVSRSGLREAFPSDNIDEFRWGIWGHEVDRKHIVKEGDRIEIYRPLAIDPREARRKLALVGKTMGNVDPN